MRRTRTSAWDWVHDTIKHITRAGCQWESTSSENHLAEMLDELYAMNLPIAAIVNLSYVVEDAYAIGRDRAELAKATGRAPT